MQNVSTIVALIAAMAAILAPILTAFLNNKHALRMKLIERYYNNKYELYRDFAKTFGKMSAFSKDYNDYPELISLAYQIIAVSQKDVAIQFWKLVETKPKDGEETFINQVHNCIKSLNNELELIEFL